MDFPVGLGVNIVTEIGKYSVKPITCHVGYVFHFNKNVAGLGIAKKDLKLKYGRVKADVERAKSNTEVVENDVEEWLQKVEEVEKDEIVERKIQENKMCCNGLFPDWIWRYKISKEATQNTIIVKALIDSGNFERVSYPTPTPGIEIFSSSGYEVLESRNRAFDQIMDALRDDNSRRIGVWGMGGVGKTTMVKEVYKKAKELNLFNDIVMAVVSQPPDIRKIQNEIAGHLNLNLEEKDDSERARRMCLRIKKAEKILIILDDIWKEVNFEDIGIPSSDDHKGYKILLTTRNEHVCNLMSCEKKVQLKMMTEKESLDLFKKIARIGDDFLAFNDDVVGEVVKECRGLPIAIVAVGKALIKKPLNDWKAALQQLRNSKLVDIEGVDVDKNAYVCLKWSYDCLKKETKLCFLLCSLFPEDHEISIEDLTRYAIGLEVYDDVKSIDEGRILVCSSINNLKESSLLLDASSTIYGEERVKMHDMVRDVALWITSKGENEFSLRTCTRLENIKNTENVTAISLWANNSTKQLPDKLVCTKLNILSLGDIPYYKLKNNELLEISDTLFEGMKGLKVLSLRNKFLSSQSLQFLKNLRYLYLRNCNFDDLSSLGKLKCLEILSVRSCQIVALPNELGGLNNLKVLDLLDCYRLKMIPPNLIQALSQLEELHVRSYAFNYWEVEGRSIERSHASLSELMSLSNLAVLSLLCIVNNLPNGFVFPKLLRYDIYIDQRCSGTLFYPRDYPNSRVLRIRNVDDASSLNAFKVLFCTVEQLTLKECKVECITDVTGGNNTAAFSNLVELHLEMMYSLRTFWEGPIHHTTFHNLTVFSILCMRMTNLFSPLLVQNLENLVSLTIWHCYELKQIISEEEILFTCHNNQPAICFPKLRRLNVGACKKLEYLFSISVARGFLLQLEELKIEGLPKLKQVFGDENKEEVGLDKNKFELSKLRKLSLQNLPKLSCFFRGNISSTWPSLEKLLVMRCPKLTSSFVTDEPNMRAVKKKLQVFNVNNCSQLCNTVLDLLTRCMLDLEELKIESCEGLDDLLQREILLPSRLKILSLKDVLVQRFVWKDPTQLVNLKELELCRCNRLRHLFSSATIAQSLQQLKSLTIEECDELEHLIAEDEEDQILAEGHFQPLYFPKLSDVIVKECNKMKSLFPITIAQSLQQLKSLAIEKCDELEHFIAEDEKDQILAKGHLQPLYFSKLSDVIVNECNKMKSLFPITIAHSLQQLGKLSVEGASQLVEVFAHEDEGDVGVRKDVRLPMLWWLTLKHLPSLVNFCPRNYHFILPSLDRLTVLSCPNMSTSFGRTPDLTVHVNGKVPQLDEKDESAMFSTTDQVVAARPTNKDIDWHKDRNLDALPLFKEEPQK